jgi:excisionase family DNA binding protein
LTDPELTPERLDTMLTPPARKLWGAPSIATALGVSVDTVRKWAKEPGVPIYNPRPRTYFAYRSELEAWLRTKAA